MYLKTWLLMVLILAAIHYSIKENYINQPKEAFIIDIDNNFLMMTRKEVHLNGMEIDANKLIDVESRSNDSTPTPGLAKNVSADHFNQKKTNDTKIMTTIHDLTFDKIFLPNRFDTVTVCILQSDKPVDEQNPENSPSGPTEDNPNANIEVQPESRADQAAACITEIPANIQGPSEQINENLEIIQEDTVGSSDAVPINSGEVSIANVTQESHVMEDRPNLEGASSLEGVENQLFQPLPLRHLANAATGNNVLNGLIKRENRISPTTRTNHVQRIEEMYRNSFRMPSERNTYAFGEDAGAAAAAGPSNLGNMELDNEQLQQEEDVPEPVENQVRPIDDETNERINMLASTASNLIRPSETQESSFITRPNVIHIERRRFDRDYRIHMAIISSTRCPVHRNGRIVGLSRLAARSEDDDQQVPIVRNIDLLNPRPMIPNRNRYYRGQRSTTISPYTGYELVDFHNIRSAELLINRDQVQYRNMRRQVVQRINDNINELRRERLAASQRVNNSAVNNPISVPNVDPNNNENESSNREAVNNPIPPSPFVQSFSSSMRDAIAALQPEGTFHHYRFPEYQHTTSCRFAAHQHNPQFGYPNPLGPFQQAGYYGYDYNQFGYNPSHHHSYPQRYVQPQPPQPFIPSQEFYSNRYPQFQPHNYHDFSQPQHANPLPRDPRNQAQNPGQNEQVDQPCESFRSVLNDVQYVLINQLARRPEPTLNQPEAQLEQPEVQLEQPEVQLGQPEAQLGLPIVELGLPDAELGHPEADLAQPEVEFYEPEVILPDFNVYQHNVNLYQPDAYLNQPDAYLNQPEAYLNQPEVNLNQPEDNVNKPEANENQPEADENEPEADPNELPESPSNSDGTASNEEVSQEDNTDSEICDIVQEIMNRINDDSDESRS